MHRHQRVPVSLHGDLKRIAGLERVPYAELEREWLRALVELYDADERYGLHADRG